MTKAILKFSGILLVILCFICSMVYLFANKKNRFPEKAYNYLNQNQVLLNDYKPVSSVKLKNLNAYQINKLDSSYKNLRYSKSFLKWKKSIKPCQHDKTALGYVFIHKYRSNNNGVTTLQNKLFVVNLREDIVAELKSNPNKN